jgi:hypothetical protein
LSVTLRPFAENWAAKGPAKITRPLSNAIALWPSTMMWTSAANPHVVSTKSELERRRFRRFSRLREWCRHTRNEREQSQQKRAHNALL